MLLTGGIDIDAWLSDLKPALPIQKEKYKGIIFTALILANNHYSDLYEFSAART